MNDINKDFSQAQSEESIMMSVYQFGANNPVSYNDPLGNKQTRTQGEGEEPGYLSQWDDIYNGLYYGGSGYGGKWVPSQSAEGGSYGFFSSDADAFRNGSMDMDWNNSWGNDGFANSFQDAQSSYYKNGGTDAEVGYLAPTVYLKGFSKQALADLDMQIARNARLGFGGNEGEGKGWETAHTVIDASILTIDLTIHGTVGAQKLANSLSNTSSEIINLGERSLVRGLTVDLAGKSLGAVTTLVSAAKFIDHSNWNDGTDAVVGTVTALSGPVGWIIGGVYFLGNTISQNVGNYETLGERLGDLWDWATN